MKNVLFLIFTCLLLSSCLSKQPEWKKKNVQVDLSGLYGQETKVTTTDVEDLDTNEKYSYDEIEEHEIIVEDYQPASVFDDEEKIAEIQSETFNEPIVFDGAIRAPASISLSTYRVLKNDSYMKIAWKLYGDITRWKEISSLNSNLMLHPDRVINVPSFSSPFNWSVEGDPYLIHRGDTLGKISTKKYESSKYWKDIWKHNEALIKNPDLIFAGFTIYTLPLKERQIASENQ